MQDVNGRLAALRRPKLLVRAARMGAGSYSRSRDLARVLGRVPGPGAAAMQLMDIEYGLNEQRLRGEASYSLMRHVSVLIALMGEAELLRAARGPRPV